MHVGSNRTVPETPCALHLSPSLALLHFIYQLRSVRLLTHITFSFPSLLKSFHDYLPSFTARYHKRSSSSHVSRHTRRDLDCAAVHLWLVQYTVLEDRRSVGTNLYSKPILFFASGRRSFFLSLIQTTYDLSSHSEYSRQYLNMDSTSR